MAIRNSMQTTLTLIDALTHLPLDKMAAISQTTFSNAFSWKKMLDFFTELSLKFVPKGPIDNNLALV